MKRPLILYLVMIGLIAALFGSFVLMGNIMESSYADMEEYAAQNLQVYLGKYEQVRDTFIPELDEGKLDRDHAALLTQYVFEYYYRCYDISALAGEGSNTDISQLDDIRSNYMLDILHSRMYFTDEDMEAAKDDIMEGGFFHTSESNKYSDRYFERYR